MKQPVDFLTGHANQWYVNVAEALMADGNPVVSRGRAVHEALHTVLRLEDPRKRVLTVPFRRANPFFQAAETVWILAGRADAEWILKYNKQLGQFLDTAVPRPGFFHGAYGERLRRWGQVQQLDWRPSLGTKDQLDMIIRQLRNDPGSRRAVAVLHNPHVDNVDLETRDRPCNIALSVQQRDGRLHLAVFNRSNDLTLGLSYTNIVQFTTLQEFLASALQLELGTYSHFSSSLHVYDDDAIARRCVAQADRHRFDVYNFANPTPMASWPKGSQEGFALIDALTTRSWSAFKAPACPYWHSVRLMLQVWDALRGGTGTGVERYQLDLALDLLKEMPAQDWRIACYEFLHRWARRRDLAGQLERALGATGLPDAVLRFITHDRVVEE